MALATLVYAAVLIFAIGNLHRLVRSLRMPAHLRWELYPIPHGTRSQRLHGGSYFEESEWWTRRPKSNRSSELAFIIREILTLKGVWDHHRTLWLWSWLMHIGLYSLVCTGVVTFFAAVTRTEPRFLHGLPWVAMLAGWVGALGVLATRTVSPRLRPYTSPGTVLNLGVIAAIFGTGLAALIVDPAAVRNGILFCGSLLGRGESPALSMMATAHVAMIAVFLAYFPFTHMTHAYMKFFTYHSVRWNDAAAVHDPKAVATLERNLSRRVSWAAPHISSEGTKTWLEVVSQEAASEQRH